MRVKCILCDRVDTLEPFSLLAKELQKKRKLSYLCPDCDQRITQKVKQKSQESTPHETIQTDFNNNK
ncbi:DUF2197 domain-containing protein [Allobacillus sp. GCM10007491]|uniref:DUF2197 domain-containing protein n=2 Tax=Allobacillus TaxID=1400133 RepID=A0A941HT95_9BACI|nr:MULTISPECIES: DUF2197 domain-containing protein [Allobacillus]MBR7553540.1 DUF2197 domain-containing protein [Allobacillus saliphilus]TSJ65374.1 DUF2197 domain-containing protein [Allobacillus salarius]